MKIREDPCRYLGQHWDRSIRAFCPDPDNRCFARFRRVPFLWLFAIKRSGDWIDLTVQGAVCYGNFRQCQDYQKISSWPDPTQGSRERS